MPYPMEEYWFMGLMLVAAIGLIGLLLYIRNKPQDDD